MLLIKELFARYQDAQAQLEMLDESRAIFNDSLLSQLSDLTEATLSSYTADEGDFEEVMRAYIAQLNANIELLQLDINRLKVISILGLIINGFFAFINFLFCAPQRRPKNALLIIS